MSLSNTEVVPQSSTQGTKPKAIRTLKVDWSWRKFQALISDPSTNDKPLYIVKCNPLTMKLKFLAPQSSNTVESLASKLDSASATSSSDEDAASNHPLTTKSKSNPTDLITTGIGNIHAIKIDPTVVVNSRAIRVSAASRLLTHYKYLSTIFTSHAGGQETMTWRCPSNIRAFDLLLTDSSKTPIARFTANYLSFTNCGAIELYSELAANDVAALNEVVVTGWTLYQTMVYRASSPVPLVGAAFARTGRESNVPVGVGKSNGDQELGTLPPGYGPSEHELEDKKLK
jgi:hypothetical protein